MHSIPPILQRFALFCLLLASRFSASQIPSISAKETVAMPSSLARHYKEGEELTYHMKGDNDGWAYEVQAKGIVKKDASGHYVEEYGWSDFKSSVPMPLSASSLSFRQSLSLDPAIQPAVPNLSQVQPFLIGPITDMLTFYSDLWIASRQSTLMRKGDHAYVKFGGPVSWADGSYVIMGEDSIDFDLTIKELDAADQIATLLVCHLPPPQPKVKLPAPWMQTAVADAPNNFIDVKKNSPGKYVAEVGKETFDVEIKVSLKDGKILTAKMDNLVRVRKRECTDAALLVCGEPADHPIRRQIELQLVP
jgi:hypothetical protein